MCSGVLDVLVMLGRALTYSHTGPPVPDLSSLGLSGTQSDITATNSKEQHRTEQPLPSYANLIGSLFHLIVKIFGSYFDK